MADLPRSGGKFSFGRVIRTAVGGVRQNFAAVCALSAFLVGIPGAIFAFRPLRIVAGAPFWSQLPADIGDRALLGAALLWSVLGALILNGAMLHALTGPPGSKASMAECLGVGVRRFPAMAGVTIVAYACFVLGLVALIVPGVIVLLAWYIAPTALIAERIGIRAALKRSAGLTKGNRWRMLLIVMVPLVVGSSLTRELTRILETPSEPLLFALLTSASALAAMLRSVLDVALSWATYVELRRVKEGIGPEGVEALFD